MHVSDAQVLTDAAARDDAESVQMVLSVDENNICDAWFHALFSFYPRTSATIACRQGSELATDDFPRVCFANSHLILAQPHISLRVLLLLPTSHCLPWRALHAVIEGMLLSRIVERQAMSYLSEIRRFLLRTYSDFVEGSTSESFLKEQMSSLVQTAAYQLIFCHANQTDEHSNCIDNQNMLHLLEIIPFILSVARRIDQLSTIVREKQRKDVKFTSNFVAEICDKLFDPKSSPTDDNDASMTADVLPFSTLALNCASFLQPRHWENVQNRLVVSMLTREGSFHAIRRAELLRIIFAILTLSNEQSSIYRSEASLPESNTTYYGWEYVTFVLYATAYRSETENIFGAELVLLSEMAQLPCSSVLKMLNFIQFFVSDIIPSVSSGKQEFITFYSSFGLDHDLIFRMCCNFTLTCFKSQDTQRRTLQLAVSALNIPKSAMMDCDHEVVKTVLAIVHVKLLLIKSEPTDNSKASYQIGRMKHSKTRTILSKQQLVRFTRDFSLLSSSFYISSGGQFYLEESCADNGIKSFSNFLFACTEVVYQSVHSGHDHKDINCSSHELMSRSTTWKLLAVLILSWIPTSTDIIQLYLLAISTITCIFMENPALRAEIVHYITIGLSPDTSSDKSRASIFCSLFNLIVRSAVSHPHNSYLQLEPDGLHAVLEPIFRLINSRIVLMDHENRNSLLRTVLLLPSARRNILSLGQKLLINHKRGLKQISETCNDLSVALDILLELLRFHRFSSEHETCSQEAILILNQIILFDNFSLLHSDKALLFHKLTEMARTRMLSQLSSLQLLRVSLRKLILYFASPDNPSLAGILQDNTSDDHYGEMTFLVPSRNFSKRCIANSETISGLLHLSLSLAVTCDSQFLQVILSILQESLGMKGSTCYLGNLKHVEPLNEQVNCNNIVSNVTLSICRVLLSSLLSENSGGSYETNEEIEERIMECLNHQATLAAEFEREYVSVSLSSPPVCEPFRNNIVEDSTVRSTTESSEVQQALITSLRYKCFDVIMNFLLHQHKRESAAVESKSLAEFLRFLDYFCELHPKPLDADLHSRVRLDSALTFFYLTLPFDGSLLRYPFATQYYCIELNSVLNDESHVESSFHSIMVVVDSLLRSYACIFCDRPPTSYFSSDQSLQVESKCSSKSEVQPADLMCSMITLICKCLSVLRSCLSRTVISPVASEFINIRQLVFGGESCKGMPWLNLINKVCADVDVALGDDSDRCSFLVHQLKIVEGSLDFISVLLPLCKLSHREVEVLNGLCSGICTVLWSIACKRKIKNWPFLRPTLRLLLLRVPFLTASMNTSNFFLSPSPFNGGYFILKAAQQCFNFLKSWHKEEKKCQWNAKMLEESAKSREPDALSFGTIDEWSSCLDFVLSAFDQIWIILNNLLRTKTPTFTDVDGGLFSQEAVASGAVNIKNYLESMLITLCDFLGEADDMDYYQQQSESILYALLLSPRSKNLLSTVLVRVTLAMKSAVKCLHQRLDNASKNDFSVVCSISCLASLVDNSKVPCRRKVFAAGTRKWFDLERKRSDNKTTSLSCRDNYSTFLGRLPAVLFRIELFESTLQKFSASFRSAIRIGSNSSRLYENLWQNVQYTSKKSKAQKQLTKCDSIVLKSLSNYFSTAKQSGSFGMAIILDNGNEEDDNSLSEPKNAAGQHDSNDWMYSLCFDQDSRRRKRARKQSLRKVWNKRHISAPRSRNKAVDDWLQSDSDLGDDTFADLEDFLVPG